MHFYFSRVFLMPFLILIFFAKTGFAGFIYQSFESGGESDNNISIKIFDHKKYFKYGCEYWTEDKAVFSKWTKITALFDKIKADGKQYKDGEQYSNCSNLELDKINKIEITNYYPGEYFIDSIVATDSTESTRQVYQDFEGKKGCSSHWVWPHCTVGRCDKNTVYDGKTSWRIRSESNFNGVGIKSKKGWHVNLHPEINDRLTFWIYALPITDENWTWPNTTTGKYSSEVTYLGNWSWKISATDSDNGSGIKSSVNPWNTNFKEINNDRLSFWFYPLPVSDKNAIFNNIGVRFFDNGKYKDSGFEVWTTQKAKYGQWNYIKVLFSQLPYDFDLEHTNKIEFTNYWPGTYYFDNIKVLRENLIYQSFEPEKRGLPIKTDEFGWGWGNNTVVSLSNDQAHEGEYSWKFVLKEKYAGTGIKSEQQYYLGEDEDDKFWHVNLEPEINDRISLYILSLTDNGFDNNINIQFYDNENDSNDAKVEFWTNQTFQYGKWTRITIPFDKLLKEALDLNLKDLNHIQIQTYWPGTYYIDNIKATGYVPDWDKSELKNGILKWKSKSQLDRYRLEVNTIDSSEGWTEIQTSTETSFVSPHISRIYYRVRSEEAETNTNTVPFTSDWSEVLVYNPPSVVIDKSILISENQLVWTNISNADSYEVQSSTSLSGPWETYYEGPYPSNPLSANENVWYRVRAKRDNEITSWSAPLRKSNPLGFLRAVGTSILDNEDEEIFLRGVNLGNYFLFEDWMAGIDEKIDDFTMREQLKKKCPAKWETLIDIYRDAFLQEYDFDLLKELGVNFIRFPLYYIDLQNEDGTINPEGFERIDWVMKASAERGMYVLLDMHGAPGSQSNEFHTGRMDFNKLFETDDSGQYTSEAIEYQNKTNTLWKEIAKRYKQNTTLIGFDLLNEPVGVIKDKENGPIDQEKAKLWDFYDRLYKTIRSVDENHIIMMEGIWDWDTLPNPSIMGWENIVYQFHYYGFHCGQYVYENGTYDFEKYKTCLNDFIDSKVSLTQEYQIEKGYNVPTMVGEFNAFDSFESWKYYLSKFNENKWLWTMWSYKVSKFSSWGLIWDSTYSKKEEQLDFFNDSCEELENKLANVDTLTHYEPNHTLINLVKHYLSPESNQYTLTVNKAGSGSGTVTTTQGDNINCGTDCEKTYDIGQEVALKAEPDEGSVFAGWSGDNCRHKGLCISLIYSDTSITATFLLEYRLQVAKNGSGNGRVVASTSGIDCGDDCEEKFPEGTALTLSAIVEEDTIFTGWSGAEHCGTEPSCNITINKDISVNANFVQKSINPSQGTFGSEFTITGIQTKKTPKVYLQTYNRNGKLIKKKIKVVSWDNTQVTCILNKTLQPDQYNVFVNKQKLPDHFTVRCPEIDMIEPSRVFFPTPQKVQ